MGDNIESDAKSVESLNWDAAGVAGSLEKVRAYVEAEALKAASWYMKAKGWKATMSRAIRLIAIVATALAGLLPIALTLVSALRGTAGAGTSAVGGVSTGLWSSLLVGLAAALLGVDRAFGFSTGWIRYILTASTIRKCLEEFRLDWALLTAKAGATPTPAQLEEMLRRAKDFRLAIEGYVIQETKDWATEFENSLAQIEKDAKTQLEALKAQVDRETKAAQEGSRPSALELTVPNAGRAEQGFTVTLEGVAGQLVQEHVATAGTWSRVALAPGQYKLTLSATVGGKARSTSKILDLAAGAVARETLALPEA